MEERFNQQHRKIQRLYGLISRILHIMIAVCLLLIFTGLIMYIISGTAHDIELTPLSKLVTGLLTFTPAGFITAGLIVMLLMPPAILFASFAHFIAVREAKPILVCLVLVLMLAASYILVFK